MGLKYLATLLILACAVVAADAGRDSLEMPAGRRLQQAAEVSDKEVLALFTTWNAALQTKDPKKVAALYAPKAVLLPTVSNIPRDTPGKIIDYFVKFLKLKPVGTINKYYIHRSDKVIINSGVYTFKLTRGKFVESVQARYTYVYELIDGKWLITEHHSSAMPETPLPTQKEIKNLFNVWNKALATLNPKKVAALYTKDGILLPTVSNKVRDTPAKIQDYFKSFLKYKPQGVIDESHVVIWSPSLATDAGIYTFALRREGRVDKVQARYSFVYQKVDGKWLIAEHHSSAMPEAKLPTQKEVHTLFDLWAAALKAKDINRLMGLYAPNATVLPTMDGKVLNTAAEVRGYFTWQFKQNPVGRINEEHIKILSPTIAINDGLFTLTVTQNGKRTPIKARYSFTYTKIGDKWFIQDQHTSRAPK